MIPPSWARPNCFQYTTLRRGVQRRFLAAMRVVAEEFKNSLLTGPGGCRRGSCQTENRRHGAGGAARLGAIVLVPLTPNAAFGRNQTAGKPAG